MISVNIKMKPKVFIERPAKAVFYTMLRSLNEGLVEFTIKGELYIVLIEALYVKVAKDHKVPK